jgi:catechol 2,3-dioxygenase-like lactoylglutathione lyase family enzyme
MAGRALTRRNRRIEREADQTRWERKMVLMNVRLGTNDVAKARAFYDATFEALGVGPSAVPPEYPMVLYKLPGGPNFAVGAAKDGQPATHANGGTILFRAESDDAVRAWHAAGLANGGSCEGQPEPKPQARGAFGAYLRDPDGNKLGAYHGLNLG